MLPGLTSEFQTLNVFDLLFSFTPYIQLTFNFHSYYLKKCLYHLQLLFLKRRFSLLVAYLSQFSVNSTRDCSLGYW